MDYKELPSISGIYLIVCAQNEKMYVGQAVNIRERIKRHLKDLRANKHHSKKLQRSYAKYGEDSLTVHVLVECTPDDLNKTEQEWLDLFALECSSGEDYFNNSLIASSCRGVKLSDDTRKKMSDSHKGKKLSPEHVANARAGRKSYVVSKDVTRRQVETRRINGTDGSKEFSFIDPNGIVHTGRNIKAFAKEHGLCFPVMVNLANSKVKQHKGWRKYPIEYEIQKRTKEFSLVDPNGVVHHIDGLKEFARTHGFRYTGVANLKNGYVKSYKGWTLYKD